MIDSTLKYIHSMLELNCPIGERTQAFVGLLAVLKHNPSIVLGNKTHIYSFARACCAAWQDEEEAPPAVMGELREVLVAVRGHNGPMWQRVMTKMDPGQVEALVQLFRL